MRGLGLEVLLRVELLMTVALIETFLNNSLSLREITSSVSTGIIPLFSLGNGTPAIFLQFDDLRDTISVYRKASFASDAWALV